MANIFFDGFGYANTADLTTYGWNNTAGSINATAGPRGGPALQFQGGAAIYRLFPSASSGNRVVFGFWINGDWTGGVGSGVCIIFDQDSFSSVFTKQLAITCEAGGQLAFHRGNWNDTIYVTSPTGVLTAFVGTYLEVDLTVHSSTGILKVWADGVLVVNFTGNTNNGGTGKPGLFMFGGALNTWTAKVADFYLHDASDVSGPFNDRLGNTTRVDSHFPTANGTTSNSTPSTGSNRALTVDEIGSNGDTDYNTLASAGDKDTLVLTDLVPTGGRIVAFQTRLVAKRTSGATNIIPVIRSGGTDYDGTAVALTTSYAGYGYTSVNQTDPATSAEITESAFNALEAGYKTSADAARITQFLVETLTIAGGGGGSGGGIITVFVNHYKQQGIM